jgi:four helix bundle protein
MFLSLGHTKLDIYKVIHELIAECYHLTANFPFEERYNLTQQIKRAVLSVKLNLAEGASRKSLSERKRFYEISRGSVIEIDAAIGVCVQLNYLLPEQVAKVGLLIVRCYAMLTKMTGKSEK